MGSQGYNGLPDYYLQSSDPTTPNVGFSLKGMDPIIAENFVLADDAIGSGSSSVMVNGSVIADPNFNGSTPAAPGGSTNVVWQVDGSGNVSAYVTIPPAGVSSVFGRTGAVVAVKDDYASVVDLALGDNIGQGLRLFTSLGLVDLTSAVEMSIASGAGELTLGDYTTGDPILRLASNGTDGIIFETDTTGAQLTVTDPTGTIWDGATGGAKGAGTINAAGLYVNGVAVGTGTGTVTTVSAGDLSPLFTSSVANPSTTPTLSFSLSTHVANTVFAGPTTGADAAPTFRALVTADLPAGTGTVTSVAMTGDGVIFNSTVGGSPVTTSGTLIPALLTQTANRFLAGPTSGGAATPTFRAIVAADIPSGTVTWDTIGNAGAALTLANAGFATTFNQTSAVNWTWANTTAATSGVAQLSPILNISGQYWTGAASAEDKWTIQNSIAAGTNGASTLTIAHSGSTGTAAVQVPSFLYVGAASFGFQLKAANTNFTTNALYVTGTSGNRGWASGVATSTPLMGSSNGGVIGWMQGNPDGNPITIGITNSASVTTQVNICKTIFGHDNSGALSFQSMPNGFSIAALATPSAPTVTVIAGSGASTWGYKVVAKDASGSSIASAEGTVSNNATLGSAAVNKVLITRVNGAVQYDIYRTTVGTTPNTTGVIGTFYDYGTVILAAAPQYFVYDTGSVTLSSVSGANGTTAVYSGTIANSANNNCAGLYFTITGFVNGANNGRFLCVSSNANALTLANTVAINETHSGTAVVSGDGTTVPTDNTSGGINLTPNAAFIPGTTAVSSGMITMGGYYKNGSGVTVDTWTIQNKIDTLTNSYSLLEILHTGTPGTAGVLIGNPSFTTAIANSPYLILAGSYQVSVSLNTFAEDNWYMQNLLGTGANGTSILDITHTGTSGVSKVRMPAAQVTGILYDSSGAAGTSGQVLQSTATGTAWTTATSSVPSGSNIIAYSGTTIATGGAGWQGFSFLVKLSGRSLINLPSSWKFAINVGGAGTATFTKAVVYTTANDSLVVTAVTSVTFGGVGTDFGLSPGENLSDAISLALSTSNDYFIVVHMKNPSANNTLNIITCTGSNADGATANMRLVGGYVNGDITTYVATNTITFPAGTQTAITKVVAA